MRESSITKLLSRLGLDSSSTQYNNVRKDISSFLRESVNIVTASEDELRSVADRYLTNAASGTALGYWTMDTSLEYRWDVEEHRPKMREIIWRVMNCMQAYAIEGLHRSGPCTGCLVHTQPLRVVNERTSSVNNPRLQHFSSQEASLPQVRSDVERNQVGLGSRERLSSGDTSSLSPTVEEDDDSRDSDYPSPRRSRKRPRTTTISSGQHYTPQVITTKEKAVAKVQDTITVKSSFPSPEAAIVSQQPVSHAVNPPSSAMAPSSTTNPSGSNPSLLSGKESLGSKTLFSSSINPPTSNVRSASVTSPLRLDVGSTSSVNPLPPPAPSASNTNPSSLSTPSTSSIGPPPQVASPITGMNIANSASRRSQGVREPVEIRGRRWTFMTAEKKANALVAARACQFDVLESLLQDVTDEQTARILVAALGQRDDMIESLLQKAGPEEQTELLAAAFHLQTETVDALSTKVCCDDRLLHRKRMMQLYRRIEDCFVENDGW